MDLKTSAQYIKGVGPARFELLNRLGIHTVGDLLYYFPRAYEDRRNIRSISELEEGSFATVKAEVVKASLRRSRSGMAIFQVVVNDNTGVLEAIWFNQPFMKRYITPGQAVILYGKIEKHNGLQMQSPEFESVSDSEESLNIGRIVPVYPLTAKLNQRYLRKIITRGLESSCSFVPDVLPHILRKKLELLPLALAVRNIHFPDDFDLQGGAYKRLVFDEFFMLQILLRIKKLRQEGKDKAIVHKKEGELIEKFTKTLPFKLTLGQEHAIKEIESDMTSGKTMNRLLQGDVGSGKTIVATHALVLSVQSGFQATVMAPTEILAEQHYLLLSKMLMPLGVNVGILIGSMSKQVKEETLEDIKAGNLDVIVGTHALIEGNIQFKNLGLVVIDEQHKFGVVQRSLLRKKGINPDYLIMTATPIPRTLALTVYGDLDVSSIKELPQGRGVVSTIAIEQEATERVYAFIREEVKKERQAYIVYPLVKESTALETRAAEQMYSRFKEKEFRNLRVGLIHGQMKAQEKEKVMREFKAGKTDVLVSTTVIEVGIDVANASVMVIEHAERFGLSQLHQLRGRIGRGKHHSYCILIANPETDKAKQRIDALLSTSDGFQLAEQDLDIRGPGQFFGSAQHGLPELKIGNIVKDMALMELARTEASSLLKADPGLQDSQHLSIRKQLKERFRYTDLSLTTG